MKKLSLLLIVIVFSLTACQKDWDQIVEDNQTNEGVTSMTDMVVSSEFNWKTTKDIEVNMTGLNNNEVIYLNSPDGDVFHKGIVKSGGIYTTTITVPTYLNEIKLKHVGIEIDLKLSGKTITFAFS